jgi:C-terminal processing protease CtpA/Prc
LPLISKEDELSKDPIEEVYGGSFVGGGAAELMPDHIATWTARTEQIEAEQQAANSTNEIDQENNTRSEILSDIEISFGDQSGNMAFARRSYVISEIPASEYIFLHQLLDDASLILARKGSSGAFEMVAFAYDSFPENSVEEIPVEVAGKLLEKVGVSSDRNYMHFTYSDKTKIVPNTAEGFMSLFVGDAATFEKNIVDTDNWALTLWPKLEYQQLYSDAWRMLRDYYYDPDMGNVDWNSVHDKFLPLVARCGRREELDDVLKQMASELSALHVFVYGGEYNSPLHGNTFLEQANQIASLGAVLERSAEWSGYVVKDLPQIDPDFNPLDAQMIYSPLSDRTLRMSGQRGLSPGDVIVGVNGEAVMSVPDIHMLLRGMSGRSIRLDVLRVKSQSTFGRERELADTFVPEPVIVVPLSPDAAENLRYAAWEWKTRVKAKELAEKDGFSVGYMHLRSMSGAEGEDSFVRGFYPDYDKQGLIIDVRHNHGGNIDSWLLDVLQRKAWMYWQGRATNITTGGLGWDEQFAFRGHIVVLIDEKTSSDGEGKL